MKSNTSCPAPAKTSATGPEIKVIISPEHVAVMDPPVALLDPVLAYVRRTFSAGGPTGVGEAGATLTLSDLDFKDRLFFPAGVLPRVLSLLHDNGYEVCVEDCRQAGPRWRLDEEVVADSTDGERALLAAVATEPLGRIEVQTRADAVEACALLCRAYPRARVAVAASARRDAWRTWRALEKSLDERVGLSMSGVRQRGERVVVGTYAGVFRAGAGCDVLLLPFGEAAAGDGASLLVAHTDAGRRYALVRPQRRTDRLVQLRVEMIAGPVIHRVRRPRATVRVVMAPTPGSPLGPCKTPLDYKRVLYWHNDARNRRVAEVAHAAAYVDRAALRRVGVRRRDLPPTFGRTPRVVILVESPEHGRRLLELLPGWHMLDMMSGETDNSPKPVFGHDGPVIVTSAYAARRRVRADVVVRAAGTGWPLRVRGFPPRRDVCDQEYVLLIDFADDYDPRAAADAERRVEDYRRRGMTMATSPADAP